MAGFKNILLGTFIALFVGAILIFSGIIKVGKESAVQADVVLRMWGTFSSDALEQYITKYNIITPSLQIEYIQKNQNTIRQDLVEALANNTGPDMVIISNENFLQDRNKLYTTPFTVYPERVFSDTYIDGARVFLSDTGLMAYPLVVDPMVLYYNKDLLAAGRLLYPPKTWSGINQTAPLFLKKEKGSITQSAIALGEAINIPHFKKILSTLLLQSGAPIVTYAPVERRYIASLNNRTRITDMDALSPQEQAILYYQSFADPTNTLYSWSKKNEDAKKAFISGKTTFYLGVASELFSIQTENPNLNFDVSSMPQPDAAVRPVTYGTMYGIAILQTSRNVPSAFSAISTLTNTDFTDTFAKLVSLPPARKDLLQTVQQNPYVAVFFDQARNAFSWPDAEPLVTDAVFRDMIRRQASGEWSINQALYETEKQIQATLR